MIKKPVQEKPKNNRSRWIKENELTLCGRNACRAAFKNRPEDICRLYFAKERSVELKDIKAWCREKKLPYRELEPDALNKAAGSVHHEGVAMVVRPTKLKSVYDLTRKDLPKDAVIVALDAMSNTHNLGAILRSSAFFGAAGVLLASGKEGQALVTPSAARVAEGAVEIVPIYNCTDVASALRDLKARGVFVLGTDNKSSHSLYEAKISFPCVVVMGNEREGLSKQVRGRCDQIVSVPGCGDMESLNVSVAAGVVLGEMFRRRKNSTRQVSGKNLSDKKKVFRLQKSSTSQGPKKNLSDKKRVSPQQKNPTRQGSGKSFSK